MIRYSPVSLFIWIVISAQGALFAQNPNKATIKLQVADHYTGSPVYGASVTVFSDGNEIDNALTNEQGEAEFSVTVTSLEDATGTPTEFALGHNYPNPFLAETRVDFAVPEHRQVTAGVYNVLGQRVLNQTFYADPGIHALNLSMGNLPPGIYFLRVAAAGARPEVVKMIRQGAAVVTAPVSMSLSAGGAASMLPVQEIASTGYTFRIEHPRFDKRQFTMPVWADTTVHVTTDRLNQVVFRVADDAGREREMQLRLTAPFFLQFVNTPDTMLLRSGQYMADADGYFSTGIDEMFEIASVDTVITLRVETIETMAYEMPPNDKGLLFAVKHISGHAGYFYGNFDDERYDITHLIITREGEDPVAIFLNEYYFPIHWMFGDVTFAMMRSGDGSGNAVASEGSSLVMSCHEGETSLTFGMDLDDLVQPAFEALINEADPNAASGLSAVQDMINGNNWRDMSLRDLSNLAKSEVAKRLPHSRIAASLSISAIAKRIIDKVGTSAVPMGDVVKDMIDYLQRIDDGYYDGSDIEGPTVEMLLCRGQSLNPRECNRYFLFNKPGNVTKCVSVCIVTLRCFTDICHPMVLSVSSVMNFRANH